MITKICGILLGLAATAVTAERKMSREKREETHQDDDAIKRNGIDFFVVGDFGWVRDMTDPDMVFDAINKVKGEAEEGTNDDAEFFISMGDNIYPRNETNPTDEEWDTVMTLFERENLKDLPVWAIRGNHDCYFDDEFELEKARNSD